MERIDMNGGLVVRIFAGTIMAFSFIMPVTATADNISLNVKDSAGTDQFAVTDAGKITARKVDVEGAAINGAYTPVLRVGTNDIPYWGSGGGIEFSAANNSVSSVPVGSIAAFLKNGMAGQQGGDLTFSTSANGTLSEKMRISATGGVGIGLSNPHYQLHVANNAVIGDSQVQSTTPYLAFKSNIVQKGGPTGHAIFGPYVDGNDLGALYIGVGANADTTRNDFFIYNYGCLVGTCNAKRIYLLADEVWASNAVQISDKRFKKDITDMTDALQKVKALRAVRYKWENPQMPQDTQIGIIAQEVEKVFPELVHETDNPLYLNDKTKTDLPKMKGVEYSVLAVIALQAVKDLAEKVDDMEARLQKLEKMAGK